MIRDCTQSDLPQVLGLERACFKLPYSQGTFISFLRSRRVTFLVSETDEEVTGYIICFVERRGRALVASMAVSPKRQRTGIGSALLYSALARLRDRASEAVLQVAKSNWAAIRFYEKHGFEVKGVISGYYLDGEDAYIMSKQL